MPSRSLLLAAALVALYACTSEKIIEPETPITVGPRNSLIPEGMVLELKAYRAPDAPGSHDSVTWSSSNASIATIDSKGLLTSLTPGVTTVVAKAGSESDSTIVTVQGREGVSLVASGNTNCGLTTSSGAVCWGENTYRQTGTRSSSQVVYVPTPVPAAVEWRSLDGSWNHTCGVDSQFDIYCWGLNNVGQLGMETESDPVDPSKKVVGDRKFVSVSAGGGNLRPALQLDLFDSQETCALTREGEAMCWGRQGNPISTSAFRSSVPQTVAPGMRFASISVGNDFACAITIDRRAYCWGNNDLGQLGRAQSAFDNQPKPVEGDLRFERISAGGIHACGITTDGAAYCWGANASLQLGAPSTDQCLFRGVGVQCQRKPVQVGGSFRFKSISAAGWGPDAQFAVFLDFNAHTCGLTVDQDIVCWGYNGASRIRQRINFDEPFNLPPILLSFPNNKFKAVSAGAEHTCAVLVSGQAWCWGAEQRGQQGIPQGTSRGGGFGAVAGTFVFK